MEDDAPVDVPGRFEIEVVAGREREGRAEGDDLGDGDRARSVTEELDRLGLVGVLELGENRDAQLGLGLAVDLNPGLARISVRSPATVAPA